MVLGKTRSPINFHLLGLQLLAEKEGFEPSVQFPVRMFSKHVLSATQASLRLLFLNKLNKYLKIKCANLIFFFNSKVFIANFK